MNLIPDIHSAKPLLPFHFFESVFPILLVAILLFWILFLVFRIRLPKYIRYRTIRQELQILKKQIQVLPQKEQAYIFTKHMKRILAEVYSLPVESYTTTELYDVCSRVDQRLIPLLQTMDLLKYRQE